jgi:hypothetical protein
MLIPEMVHSSYTLIAAITVPMRFRVLFQDPLFILGVFLCIALGNLLTNLIRAEKRARQNERKSQAT